jgi:glycogen operon protein
VRFTQQVFAFRRAHPVLRREAFYTDRDIEWFDVCGHRPAWLDPGQRRVACLIHGGDDPDLFMMFNADTGPASFVLPTLTGGRRWALAIDTSRPVADADAGERPASVVEGDVYALGSQSSEIVVTASGSQ